MDTARGGTVAAAAATTLALLLAGCGDSPGGQSGASPAPGLSSFDPPLAFAEGIWLGNGHQADAFYVAGRRLSSYRRSASTITHWDLVTGAERETVAIDLEGGSPRSESDGNPFAFTEVDGEVLFVVAYEHFERGVGTRPSQNYLRVRAYHADDGALAWSQDVEPAGFAGARILAANADHTVIVTGARNPATERVGREEASVEGITTVLDTATGAVRQVWDPFVAYALDRDVVAGLQPDLAAADSPTEPAHLLQGRHVFTGETVWENTETPQTGADNFGTDLGGGALLLPARGRGTTAVVAATRSTNLVLEVATGEALLEIKHDSAAVVCRHDGELILVCSHDPVDRSGPFLAAYDLHGRTQLWDWEEIGAGRELPSTITVVYRGVVYMEYSSGGRQAVALDARTGEDLAGDLPAAPDQAGAGYGLTYEDPGHLWIYPATG